MTPRVRPLVSVLIIAYNQKDYISEAIDSALAQDYPNLEIVVTDDCSQDGTQDIVAGYAARFPDRVVAVLNPVNLGITGNCNAGLRRCQGEFIAFMGGDDHFLPGKLTAQVVWFEQDPERVVCGHQVEVFYEDGSPSHPLSAHLPEGRGADYILRHEFYGAVAVMVRASRLPPHGFEPRLPMVSDYMLYVEMLAGGGKYGFVEGTLARYRKHAANVTNRLDRLEGELAAYFDLVERRYPQYAALCRRGRVRRVLYDVGVYLMRTGRKREARGRFLAAIQAEPTFIKPWVRLVQCVI